MLSAACGMSDSFRCNEMSPEQRNRDVAPVVPLAPFTAGLRSQASCDKNSCKRPYLAPDLRHSARWCLGKGRGRRFESQMSSWLTFTPCSSERSIAIHVFLRKHPRSFAKRPNITRQKHSRFSPSPARSDEAIVSHFRQLGSWTSNELGPSIEFRNSLEHAH
jgi:hypothetical protein